MIPVVDVLNFDAKVPHELCGRRHSKIELAQKCEVRVAAKMADVDRRIQNARDVPVEEYIRRRRVEAATYDKITAELKRDYPPPPSDLIRSQEGWWAGSVIELDSRHPRFAVWPVLNKPLAVIAAWIVPDDIDELIPGLDPSANGVFA